MGFLYLKIKDLWKSVLRGVAVSRVTGRGGPAVNPDTMEQQRGKDGLTGERMGPTRSSSPEHRRVSEHLPSVTGFGLAQGGTGGVLQPQPLNVSLVFGVKASVCSWLKQEHLREGLPIYPCGVHECRSCLAAPPPVSQTGKTLRNPCQ